VTGGVAPVTATSHIGAVTVKAVWRDAQLIGWLKVALMVTFKATGSANGAGVTDDTNGTTRGVAASVVKVHT
jgi:hypothetical protein